ncbi:HAD hydrolase family protein [Mycoplasmopsis felis]|uniref:HAD family hydrolase n=1 Tax=Mycoplasmopsis felis TaxID=33923 RepID=UPI002286494C|nr:HAD hydrolase family protein [Mycoplasmopsis felis]WAM01937.1 HAD hydrolase family protein [Mycoplasmopsis felis]
MNKNNWVFAFDLDGTLLQRNNKANEYTLDVLKKSKESGNINIVATGRGLAKTLPLLESKAIDHMDYLVCSNGTVIYDVKNKSSITLNSLDKNVFDIMKNIASRKEFNNCNRYKFSQCNFITK